MQINRLSKNTVSVKVKNKFETPKIIETIRFFDRFNVELYNKLKEIKAQKQWI